MGGGCRSSQGYCLPLHRQRQASLGMVGTGLGSGIGLVYWGLTPQQQPGSYQGLVRFGVLGFNASATARVISRFG